MKEKKDIAVWLKENAKNVEIPESIKPEQMRKKLEMLETCMNIENENKDLEREDAEGKQESNWEENNWRRKDKRKYLFKYIAAAACLCLVVGTTFTQKSNIVKVWEDSIKPFLSAEDTSEPIWTGGEIVENNINTENDMSGSEVPELMASISYPTITYEDIYESMFGNMEKLEVYNGYRGEVTEGAAGILAEDFVSDGMAETIVYNEAAMSSETVSGVLSDDAVMEKASEESAVEHGTTNVRTEGVEEADVVKNDGRYLYQKIYQEKDHMLTQAIQIVDTKEGLKEVKRIEGFDNIQEFYIWEDTLVVIENKYLETMQTGTPVMEKLMICGVEDYGSYSNRYHEITFYNIKDRSMPYRIHTFTLKGSYDSSRISDGYFYGFSKFYANPGEGEEDYAAYIPLVDGVQLDAGQILLPEENEGNCYLVLTSIDLKNPTKFVDTTAVVTDSDMYYVSSDNIYIADSLRFEEGTGRKTNQISLLRFSYGKGKFALQAEGKVSGSLESSFSMDEYQGNLRMVTTVDEYWFEELKDDRTGEVIGNHIAKEQRSNALYVLNQNLEMTGKIENLAQDERIYSARFLGGTGYFVTFRQTDPLFAMDLKDPKNPKILSELKVSGFSEYLHFYGEERLLGIGMEADVETGSTDGMKLSMFDISNPEAVQEIAKLPLKQYYESEALYNHRAVMISPETNIFGFEATGYKKGNYKRDYLVFSYENDKFVQKLKIETNNKYGEMYSLRGTFIEDVFYLLTRDGSVKSYDLNTGEMLESL